jgi:hypothetical protein
LRSLTTTRGLAYYRKGEHDRAIGDYSQAITLNSKYTAAYNNRGLAYRRKGEYDRAIADYDQAITLNSKYTLAYLNRAGAYKRKGEYDRAIADYDHALTLDPGNAVVRQDRERVLADLAAQKHAASPSVIGATSQMRVALVIGNSAYSAVPILANPRRDAEAVAGALRQTGFQTALAMDLDRAGMMKALRAFRDKADRADWALVYFAGHGIEIDGTNYLIPVDAKLVDDRDLTAEAVSYEELLKATGSARALKLIILDACRNNPFKDRMHRTTASRSASRGLAPPPDPEAGTLIAFSAKGGQLAADDVGGSNSPFAHAFLEEVRRPGLEVRRLFDFVRDDVMEATDRRQQPYTYQSLGRPEYFFVAGK